MLKKNYAQAVTRNKQFLNRQLMNGILFKAIVWENPYSITENRDDTWTDRDCLAITDKEWVLADQRRKALVYQNVDDDTIPEGYPTLHFGEQPHRVGSCNYCRGDNPEKTGDVLAFRPRW